MPKSYWQYRTNEEYVYQFLTNRYSYAEVCKITDWILDALKYDNHDLTVTLIKAFFHCSEDEAQKHYLYLIE